MREKDVELRLWQSRIGWHPWLDTMAEVDNHVPMLTTGGHTPPCLAGCPTRVRRMDGILVIRANRFSMVKL
jgi:hypothetical protein